MESLVTEDPIALGALAAATLAVPVWRRDGRGAVCGSGGRRQPTGPAADVVVVFALASGNVEECSRGVVTSQI